MNKIVGVGIGVAAVIIAFVVAGGSTMLSDQAGLPNDDQNRMTMGDKLSVTVQPAKENTEQETLEENIEEESTEGKSLEVNLVDGISATSTP